MFKNIFSLALLFCASFSAQAHNDSPDHSKKHQQNTGIRADSHAPIGVMGDHLHKQGEWMISLRHMTMSMQGNLQGSDEISADDIVTSVPNAFSAMPNMPPTLRVVPQKMDMTMTMLGMMYAPSNKFTLMAMLNFVSKDMNLTTYQGMMGTNPLGEFSTSTSGLSDAKLSALIKLSHSDTHKWHLNLGLNLPLGSLDEDGEVLTPMNMRMNMRLPYSMQLGRGTYDLEPGVTYNGKSGKLTWGAQAMLALPLDENDEGYDWGKSQKLTTWMQYLITTPLSVSLRYSFESSDEINGRDSEIMAPVQTADPANYGGDRSWLSFGANVVGQNAGLRGHRFALEYFIPVSQKVNGVQMDMDDMLMFGYQYAF